MPTVKFASSFNHDYRELLVKEPNIKSTVDERIKWFSLNSNDTRLKDHSLLRTMLGRRAFRITNDIRIVYTWSSKTTVRFLYIGPHSKVYSKRPIKR